MLLSPFSLSRSLFSLHADPLALGLFCRLHLHLPLPLPLSSYLISPFSSSCTSYPFRFIPPLSFAHVRSWIDPRLHLLFPSIILARVRLLLLHPPSSLRKFALSCLGFPLDSLILRGDWQSRQPTTSPPHPPYCSETHTLVTRHLSVCASPFGPNPEQLGSVAAANKRTTLLRGIVSRSRSQGAPASPSFARAIAALALRVLPVPTDSRLCSSTKVEAIETPTLWSSWFVGSILVGTILDSPDFKAPLSLTATSPILSSLPFSSFEVSRLPIPDALRVGTISSIWTPYPAHTAHTCILRLA